MVCPTQAILVGDLGDPEAKVTRIVNRDVVQVRRPEKDTRPKLFYRGAHHATLDPLAAERPPGGMFLWSEQSGDVVSGHPAAGNGSSGGHAAAGPNSSAAAMLAYDVAHSAPWDWRVSLYTLTKSVAAGAYLVPALLLLLGALGDGGALWKWGAPALGAAFLGITGVLLISDLEHPERFALIFLRPQWRSWLVRGAFVIAGYGAVLAAHAGAAAGGRGDLMSVLRWVGIPLAAFTAAYTAYLFAQAKARDLWQSPLLPPHLVVQAVMAGAAGLLPVAAAVEPGAVRVLSTTLAAAAAAHLLLVAGELTLTHATAHARLAVHEMTGGRFRSSFRLGIAATVAALAAPWIGAWAAPLALAGLLAYEHAYVQAGQAVPLA
ncbi:MAG TPA: NrfD/PsrC family molybdoenzyme membrane anchor subunit [bacterium]|nr:NrfD/PsrC family molybdoenzyme membrane anchor subunit [bacterium]